MGTWVRRRALKDPARSAFTIAVRMRTIMPSSVARAATDVSRRRLRFGVMGRLRDWLTAAAGYPAAAEDRREVDLVGLRLPVRATIALTVVTIALLFDHSRTFLPDAIVALGRAPEAMRITALVRVLLFGLVPLAVVILLFRDRVSRYGLGLGDWRTGIVLMLA